MFLLSALLYGNDRFPPILFKWAVEDQPTLRDTNFLSLVRGMFSLYLVAKDKISVGT